jgi:hypothetical protein
MRDGCERYQTKFIGEVIEPKIGLFLPQTGQQAQQNCQPGIQ